jgi:hypothetical protein
MDITFCTNKFKNKKKINYVIFNDIIFFILCCKLYDELWDFLNGGIGYFRGIIILIEDVVRTFILVFVLPTHFDLLFLGIFYRVTNSSFKFDLFFIFFCIFLFGNFYSFCDPLSCHHYLLYPNFFILFLDNF